MTPSNPNSALPWLPEKIVLFGKGGQVCSAIQAKLPSGIRVPSLSEMDFNKPFQVQSYLELNKPKLVINCAAYTAVDLAETNSIECRQINALTPKLIADWCKSNDCIMIHFSTDYVFFDNGNQSLTEDSPKQPKNIYGETKLEGDELISAVQAHSLIFRISWVYAAQGKNFLLTMLKLGSEKSQLKVVNDQIGYPTKAKDVADAIIRILPSLGLKDFEQWGTYHLTGQEWTSWYGFAEEIFRLAKTMKFPLKLENLAAIPSEEYPTPAKRPLNSRLNGDKFYRTFGFYLPPWKESLQSCMKEIYANR